MTNIQKSAKWLKEDGVKNVSTISNQTLIEVYECYIIDCENISEVHPDLKAVYLSDTSSKEILKHNLHKEIRCGGKGYVAGDGVFIVNGHIGALITI